MSSIIISKALDTTHLLLDDLLNNLEAASFEVKKEQLPILLEYLLLYEEESRNTLLIYAERSQEDITHQWYSKHCSMQTITADGRGYRNMEFTEIIQKIILNHNKIVKHYRHLAFQKEASNTKNMLDAPP